jgi:alkylmercury lyase
MQPMAFDALARTIAEGFNWRDAALCRALLRLIARGQPIAPAHLAATLRRSPEAVTATLQHLPDIEIDTEGNIVGWGLTLNPTPHQVHIDGQTLYTWCALDTLFFPAVLHQAMRVQSACPLTGVVVSLTAAPEGMADLVPETAVVSLMQPTPGDAGRCNRANFCQQVHFFSSSEAATLWRQAHPQARIVSVPEAYQLGQVLAAYWGSDTAEISLQTSD